MKSVIYLPIKSFYSLTSLLAIFKLIPKWFEMSQRVKGYCTPDQKLLCFVLYLKIANTFLKNNICIL